jgi:hypothetical protein
MYYSYTGYYKLFKKDFVLENYLISTPSFNLRKEFTKFRISAHTLCIETGRHCKPKKPVDLRTCYYVTYIRLRMKNTSCSIVHSTVLKERGFSPPLMHFNH